jgi:hypothetical protein
MLLLLVIVDMARRLLAGDERGPFERRPSSERSAKIEGMRVWKDRRGELDALHSSCQRICLPIQITSTTWRMQAFH